LRAIYRELVESDYFRSEPKAADLMADALNNYGVSLLDLGKRDGAFQRFDQALQVEAYHPEATYNRGLVLWRSGQITDADLVTQLDEVRTTRTGIWRDEYLLGMVHLERGDAESAVKMLEEAQQSGGGLEVQTALDQARRILPDSPRCVRTFEGNIHEVNSVAFSPDGRFCLSGSGGLRFTGNENELRLWDVLTGQCVRTFEGHTKGVNSVAFSPDGRFCLSGSKDTTLRLWDALTGRCLRTFKGHTSPVWSVDFSPDGRFCLSGAGSPLQGWKKILRLWDTSTGQCVRTFEGHTEEVNSAAYSPDGRFCLSGAGSLFGEGRDQTLRLWDASTGRCLRMFEGHIGAVNSVAFSPDGRLCLSGSEDKTLRLWDASTGRCVRTFEGHTKGVNSVAFSPVGRFCLSGGRDGTLRFWDTSTGRCVRTFGHTGNVHSVAFRLDGRFCLSGGWDKTLRLWDVSPCYDKSHKTGAILSRVRDSDEAARIDREFLELLDRTRQAHAAADLSAALEYLKQARSVPGRGLVEKVLDWNHSIGKHCTKRSFSRGWMKRTFEGHAKPVRSVAFSPDGRFCLSGGFGHTPRLWDVSTGQCVRTFEGHAREVRSVAFSPDGRFCLSGSEDKTLRLWDASTGQCVRKFEGHAKPVWSVAFSPDGRFCLSGGFGRTPRLWDVSTGQCVRTFEGHAREVSSVAFSPDGRFCLSGSADSTLRLWEFDWEYEFPGWADWDEAARPYIEIFLTRRCPRGENGISRVGRPTWNDKHFKWLLRDLQLRGYGWLREEGVRKKLEEMTANWQGPPPLPGAE